MNYRERKPQGPILYLGDTEEAGDVEVHLPWKWAICDACNGNGTTTAHVECDGGGFTSSEWADQDDDFREDYLAGRYDRPCPHCEGGKVRVPDEARMSPKHIKAWHEQCESDAEIDAIHAAERMMGA